ncbi:hypothetical protein BU26DRAFT_118097 [Trematosphaeria pertusa]|uniref:ABC transmembrane type-1 domain-containing protein n=1 Tax=Trematosphaeria pertusa TaxID=390896 RepID=A0A6A6I1J6_9PLEO|nr:uncharacterized protein BU26DRAFT_118097 [Trematosphaeria pertusa]KAF2243460.1 hypothetical protein BU26DRAFT_118097 [Trematosphaeria pertusa]
MDRKYYGTVGATVTLLAALLFIPTPESKTVCANASSQPLASLIPVFMALGDPILRQALAVITGSSENSDYALPLSFSWLNYMLSALTNVFSGQRGLMPDPELDCTLMNMQSGESRKNRSWLLSRLVRNLEKQAGCGTSGLSVSIFYAGTGGRPSQVGSGLPTALFDVGNITALVQILVAAVPWCMYRDPTVLMLTAFGLTLSNLVVTMPVWRAEKFTARREGAKKGVYALMRGSGHRHVFIIRSLHSESLDLEELAVAAVTNYDWFGTGEGWVVCGVTVGWFIFTILAARLRAHAGYLLAAMALGTISTIFIASFPWTPRAHGIPATVDHTISHPNKAMDALQELEETYPGYGEKLLKTFFPGSLHPDEERWWAERKQKQEASKSIKDKSSNGLKYNVPDTPDSSPEVVGMDGGEDVPDVSEGKKEEGVRGECDGSVGRPENTVKLDAL